MKSKFVTDLQDPSDGFPSAAGAEVYTNFFPSALPKAASAFGNGAVEIPSTPAFTSGALTSSSAQSGPATITTMTAGGITINLLFDAAAMAAPQSFRDAIQQAASLLTAAISDRITVNIGIDYSGTGGGAAAGPDNGLYVSYSTVRTNLISHATPGDSIFDKLPTGTSFQGQTNVAVWNAQLKLWGLQGGPSANDTTTDDGRATFSTDINSNLLVGVAVHELTHALGRVPYGLTPGQPIPTPEPDIFDFFRFTSVGTRLILGGARAQAAYFSVDGGNTKLADYGQNYDASDFLNSGVQGSNDPFNEFYGYGTLQSLTTVDLQQLDSLGFHTMMPVTTVIEAFGSTSLVQSGAYFYLDSISSGSGPQLKFSGTPVTAGQFGGWTPIGTEQTSTGYEVAWKMAGADQYTVWNTDSSGNFVSNTLGFVSGSSSSLESMETSFHQDLNGDGVIGIPTGTVIEAFGSTKLVGVGQNFFLESTSNGSGPELKFSGAPVTAGQFGGWTPIGTEQTSTGYEVAWKMAGADQFTVWNTDSSGNFVSNTLGFVSGSNSALESLEMSFHQDLNGDGVIGIPAASGTVIESFGSTSLVEVGQNFFLNSIAGGAGVELKYGGAVVVAGGFGGWTPIGAEQTSGGYEVAWKMAGADQYTVWNTDSSGNYVSNAIGLVSGTSVALESLEASFHQDLNGDGVIGIVIESFGSTRLVQTGQNFFLDGLSSASGPELKYNGAVVVAGGFGGWTPLGAEQTSSTGYEVAWKMAGVDQYTVWNTDSSGNYVSNAIGFVPGNSNALETLEMSFHQDLNGDGVIGVPAPTSPSSSVMSAATVKVANNDTFVFHSGFDAGAAAKAGAADPIELDASHAKNAELTALSNGPQAQFHWANDGHDTAIDPGNHDSAAPTKLQLAELHAGNFIIH